MNKVIKYDVLPEGEKEFSFSHLEKIILAGIPLGSPNFIIGSGARKSVFFRFLPGYLANTKIDSMIAGRIAYEEMKRIVNQASAKGQGQQFPETMLIAFTSLKMTKPSPVLEPGSESKIIFWQVLFYPDFPAGTYSEWDEFFGRSRSRTVKGRFERFCFRIDVGLGGKVIGVLFFSESIIGSPTSLVSEQKTITRGSSFKFFEVFNGAGLLPFLYQENGMVEALGSFRPNGPKGNYSSFGVPNWNLESDRRLLFPVDRIMLSGEGDSEFSEGTLLRVVREDIGFHSYDPGVIPPGERPPSDSFKYPSLGRGELLEFVLQTKNGWLYVNRLANETKGYVDWRYIEVVDIEIPEIVFVDLSPPAIDKVVAVVCGLIRKKIALPGIMDLLRGIISPPSFRPTYFDAVHWESMLYVLKRIRGRYPIETFAEVCFKLRASGCLYKILRTLKRADIVKDFDTVFPMLSALTFEEFLDILQVLIEDELYDRLFRIGARMARALPTVKKSRAEVRQIRSELKSAMQWLFKDKEAAAAMVAEQLELFFRIKLHEIDYYLNRHDSLEIARLVIESDLMVTAAFELLFAEDPSTDILELRMGYNLIDVWNQVKSQPLTPTMYLYGDGDQKYSIGAGTASKLQDLFCPETLELFTDLPTPVLGNLEGEGYEQYQKKKEACRGILSPVDALIPPNPIPGLKQEGKDFVKTMVIQCATRLRDFIQSDLASAYYRRPEFFPEINRVITTVLQPNAVEMLSLGEMEKAIFRDRRGWELRLTATDINSNPLIIDSVSWIDLARIWHYELGSQKGLGQEGKELIFSKAARLTENFRRHPAFLLVLKYVRARTNDGNWDRIRVFVHYDVGSFWKSIQSRDVLMNLMGSFAIDVFPDDLSGMASFRIRNILSLESATRFVKEKGIETISGVVESKERDTPCTLELGGTLRCFMDWDEMI